MSAMFVAMFKRRCIVKAATMDRRALGFEGNKVGHIDEADEIDGGRSTSGVDVASGLRRGLVSEACAPAMLLDVVYESCHMDVWEIPDKMSKVLGYSVEVTAMLRVAYPSMVCPCLSSVVVGVSTP